MADEEPKEKKAKIEAEGEKQYLIIVRHGDRFDYSHPEWLETTTRRGDPPLSKLGHQQARETGAYLGATLSEMGIKTDQITWLSSPFLRCLQTSDTMLNSFPQQDTDSVKILPEYSVFEMDGHGGKMHKSLPPLDERAHYFPRLDASHESLFVPPLPEPREGLRERCNKAMKLFNQKYLYVPGTAIVIVSHAASCVALARAAANLTLAEITPASPCSIFQLTRTSQTDIWKIDPHDEPQGKNGFTDHLSEMGLATTRPWNHFGPKGTEAYYTGPPNSRFAPFPTREDSDEL